MFRGDILLSFKFILNETRFKKYSRQIVKTYNQICLPQDIKALFPPDYNPFYAGFGNRDTDELAYRKVGIPKGKIFIINPKVLIFFRV